MSALNIAKCKDFTFRIRDWLMRKPSWIPIILSILGPIIIPIAHIFVFSILWQNYARNVDQKFCTCSCWDTVFKGPYEYGISSYKHMYFNATKNTLMIWIITVLAVIALYECSKRLINLTINETVRHSMTFLFCLSIFSHYYAWWSCVNYYNDEFYTQWNHQMFFTVTQLFSTGIVLNLAKLENPITSKKIIYIVGIAILHILDSSFNQFIVNIFKGEGGLHQVIRDSCFMIPDLCHVIIPICVLMKARRDNLYTKQYYRDHELKHEIVTTSIIVIILFIIINFL